MQVTFDINQFPDLVLAANEILEFESGTKTSVDFKMFDSALSDLTLARKICEEVEENKAA
ncbi:hypothetical protein DYBT9623_04445 [Dyadobacter sp. CECT 9623]|uniref:Uncharacterized protein n=1 Tax=Dyadobacter linearis TaxID=2823330 RepID=A0ABM8UVS7_9BACT|nr:hypothetical protein [Dyadobacter sp. CECT 9623]CAG5072908.1 hypothetical protein DYBT9623_04445 [Dyadobacter sp. CECT 9623]